jgi:hypothetical protein
MIKQKHQTAGYRVATLGFDASLFSLCDLRALCGENFVFGRKDSHRLYSPWLLNHHPYIMKKPTLEGRAMKSEIQKSERQSKLWQQSARRKKVGGRRKSDYLLPPTSYLLPSVLGERA